MHFDLFRRMVALYAALFAATIGVVAVPGNPDFASRRTTIGWLLVVAVLIAFLARRSRPAWTILLILDALTVLATLGLAAIPIDAGLVGVAALALARVLVLLSPPVRDAVRRARGGSSLPSRPRPAR